MTSSHAYKIASKLDYETLTTCVPEDGTSLLHLGGGFQRYVNSKLAELYFALELDRRLRERGVENVFVNACHPGKAIFQAEHRECLLTSHLIDLGNVPKTELGNNQQPLVGPFLNKAIRNTLGLFMRNSRQDAAKTQVFLSASRKT